MVTRRLALGVEYDGTGFAGWQRQHHARSVQGELELALSRIADHPVTVTCAGRTDAGVHATQQVVHFDTTARRHDEAWVRGVNTHLPADVGVTWVSAVAPDFHARFDALARCYRYVILGGPQRPILHRARVAWTWKSLNPQPMQEAAKHLLGEHDFSSFRAAGCQARHAVRRIDELRLQQRGSYLYVDIQANAFLHHMVRNIAGVLIAVGAGERPPAWAEAVLAARDRRRAAVTAPSEGLYLVAVSYPAARGIDAQGWRPVFA